MIGFWMRRRRAVAELRGAAQDVLDARDIANLSEARLDELVTRYCSKGLPSHPMMVAGAESRLRAALANMPAGAGVAS